MALPPKQKLFVQEYLKDKNITRAAKAAGFSKKSAHSQGSRLLKNVKVAQAVEAGLEKQLIKAELTGDMIIAELRKLAFVDISKAYKTNGKLLHPHDMPEDVRLSLSSVETDEILMAQMKIGETKKIKLYDKVKSLELLGKHFKVFTEVVESKSVVKEIPPTEEEIKEWGKRFKNEF